MGRLKDWAYRPFHRQRGLGLAVPDYYISSLVDDTFTIPTSVPLNSGGSKPYIPAPVQRVAIDNGYWSQLMPRDQVALDVTDVWQWDWDTILTGPVTILQRKVPNGLAWHLDNMYFFANAIGGVGGIGNILLPPAALSYWIILRVFVSSSQLKYESWENILVNMADPKVSFPFLNDRIGPREANFGVTLYEGEFIRAYLQTRRLPAPLPPEPPPYPLRSIGFRFMGIEGSKAMVDDYLRRKRWDGI
jgi:hypothetical protein